MTPGRGGRSGKTDQPFSSNSTLILLRLGGLAISELPGYKWQRGLWTCPGVAASHGVWGKPRNFVAQSYGSGPALGHRAASSILIRSGDSWGGKHLPPQLFGF